MRPRDAALADYMMPCFAQYVKGLRRSKPPHSLTFVKPLNLRMSARIQQLQGPAPAATLKISGLLTAKEDPLRTKATKVKGGGLAHGTGRIRPAIINRSDSAASKNRSSPPSQQPPLPHPSKPAPQPKLCTVIDQGPIPLYCSDKCRLKDLSRLDGALSIDYNPNSASTPLSPMPHNSSDRSVQCKSEDESNSFVSFSLDSCSSSSDSGPVSPSLTTLSAIYRFPPLPPTPPILPMSAKPSPPEPQHLHNYQSGVMMSAKRIQAALCAPQSTKRPWLNKPQPPCKPIPGWTDGSQDWHESIYSFSPPSSSIVAPGLETKPCPVAASNGPRATLTCVNHPARYLARLHTFHVVSQSIPSAPFSLLHDVNIDIDTSPSR
ncbi:hypothetical protein EDD17DRAFT_1832648 [Pisolithus thermaeus]|nr:hypothetical protein EDD17DRAFT_1832648 [Pisolithus thermaeus]